MQETNRLLPFFNTALLIIGLALIVFYSTRAVNPIIVAPNGGPSVLPASYCCDSCGAGKNGASISCTGCTASTDCPPGKPGLETGGKAYIITNKGGDKNDIDVYP